MASNLPSRFVLCVDGTRCIPDEGPQRQVSFNYSNVYRIFASVKAGQCRDEITGTLFTQVKRYYDCAGSKNDKAVAGEARPSGYGDGVDEQIAQVYEDICRLPIHPNNEVWLFGFGRGAFIARAVASLLHHFGAMTTAGTSSSAEDYKNALAHYRYHRYEPAAARATAMRRYLSDKTAQAPKIQFVGVFDTVKALEDKTTYDISVNSSIQHLRHALALHEDRRNFEPRYCWERPPPAPRTIVQAWFVGAHIDIGGSALKDGLALYPLQWMLFEARRNGLVMEFDAATLGNQIPEDNPLELVLPRGTEKRSVQEMTAKNGLKFDMFDIRAAHADPRYNQRYVVHLNRSTRSWLSKRPRRPFNDNDALDGYCEFAPHGTIVHPSVYLILDEYPRIFLNSKSDPFRITLEKSRSFFVPDNFFWANDNNLDQLDEPSAMRILICGNSGVGKSTLINQVFGVELTTSSDRDRGIHDIREAITDPSRPDLIIHDSRGFESGGEDEIQQVKDFIREKSGTAELKDQLHMIWFCVEINSARTRQTATTDLFSTLSQSDIPVVIIGTKKDEYWDIKFGEGKRKARLLKDPDVKSDPEKFANEYADGELTTRMELIDEELSAVDGGRFDAIVAVSIYDDASISDLTMKTAACFSHDRIRQMYVAAQVRDIDLKFDSAVRASITVYKQCIKSAAALAAVPTGPSANKVSVAYAVCKKILNCFGLPGIGAAAVYDIMKTLVWDDMGHNVGLAFSEAVAAVGALGCAFSFGGSFIAAALITTPIVVPATARLTLMLAADVMVILTRAFKECIDLSLAQPRREQVRRAALAYRGAFSKRCHADVAELVPLTLVPWKNIMESFQTTRIQLVYADIVRRYKDEFVEGAVAAGASGKSRVASVFSDASSATAVDSIGESVQKLPERTAPAELSGVKDPAELPGPAVPVELPTKTGAT